MEKYRRIYIAIWSITFITKECYSDPKTDRCNGARTNISSALKYFMVLPSKCTLGDICNLDINVLIK